MGNENAEVMGSPEQIAVQPMDIRVLAMAALGEGLSGSDRIFIELARRWMSSGHRVHIHVWEEGRDMCLRNGLPDAMVSVWPAKRAASKGRVASYVGRSLIAARSIVRSPDIDPETVL